MKKRVKKKSKKHIIIFKGFTLVELLAVIVILAIILLISIPAVLNSLSIARKKSFIEYVSKIYTTTEKQFLVDQMDNYELESCVLYNIKDIGLASTGDYEGYTLIVKDSNEKYHFYLTLYDKTYMISGLEYSTITIDSLEIFEEGDSLSVATLLDKAGCDSSDYTYAPNGTNPPSDIGNSTESNTINNLIKNNKLKLGDFIEYIPSETSVMPDITKSGCSETSECNQQALNPSEITLWRILQFKEDNLIEIIAYNQSTTPVSLYGRTGYINSVDVLQSIASKYINPKYASSARCFGYYNQTPNIKDTSKIDSNYPWKTDTYHSSGSNFHENAYEELGGGDIYWKNDVELLRNVSKAFYKTPYASVIPSSGLYWTASRSYEHFGGIDYFIQVNSANGNYNPLGNSYVGKPGILIDYNRKQILLSYYFEPIVTLKKSAKIVSGSGNKDDPYKLA